MHKKNIHFFKVSAGVTLINCWDRTYLSLFFLYPVQMTVLDPEAWSNCAFLPPRSYWTLVQTPIEQTFTYLAISSDIKYVINYTRYRSKSRERKKKHVEISPTHFFLFQTHLLSRIAKKILRQLRDSYIS